MRRIIAAVVLLVTPAAAQTSLDPYNLRPNQPGGVVQLDSAGTASATLVVPHGGSAARSLGAALGERLSLADFGAVCDGVTDDSAAITAAMASGVDVAIPSGLTCYGASIGEAGITGVFVGPGQIKTSDGNLRGPIVTQMSAPPVRLGTPNIVQGFNGDLTHVPLAIEARITGASTLGQPASTYQFTNEASPVYISLYNESGWNQGTGSTGPGTGRTGFAEVNLDLTQNGQGDATGLFESLTVSGPNKAGATSFLANPAASMLGGAVYAGHAGVYLQGIGDIDLIDSGYDVAAIASTLNLTRTVGTGALGATWIGERIQSTGSVASDAAVSAGGLFRMVVDAIDAPAAATVVAGPGQRYYANASQPSTTAFPATIVLGTEYMDYSVTNGWEWVTASGSLSFGTANNRLSAGAGQANAGIGSVALGGYSSVSGTYGTALGGAHQGTAANSTLLGLAAADRGNIGATCHASGAIASGAAGSAQSCEYTLRAVTSSTAGTRLTADGNALAAGGANSVSLQIGSAYATDITVMARDTAAPGIWSRWTLVGGALVRDSSGTSYTGPQPTQMSAGAGSAAALAIGADAGNTCLSLTFQAPNTDAWHVVATVRTTEAM